MLPPCPALPVSGIRAVCFTDAVTQKNKKTFFYPVPPPEDLDELNQFLDSHRILSADHQIVIKDSIQYLIFIISYLNGKQSQGKGVPWVNYRETLSEADFALFSKLRELRKELVEKDGVPVYTVFTNAQLATITEEKIQDHDRLMSIPGVGKSKVEKYGDAIIELCRKLFKGAE